MTAPSPDEGPNLQAPIILTGPGLAKMTSERLAMLDQMVYGLGLVASRSEVPGDIVELDNPHAIARDLVYTQKVCALLRGPIYSRGLDRPSHDYDPGLDHLVNVALWVRIKRDARAAPSLMYEVARCLAATPLERGLACAVADEVYKAHLERGARDAAASAVAVIIGVAGDTNTIVSY